MSQKNSIRQYTGPLTYSLEMELAAVMATKLIRTISELNRQEEALCAARNQRPVRRVEETHTKITIERTTLLYEER